MSSSGQLPIVVTTSWDDGDPSDIRVAELLSNYGLRGTFYVPLAGSPAGVTLSHAHLRELCESGFEIGGHTISHVKLQGIHGSDLQREINNCKLLLQQITGREVQMFCYPLGWYDSEVVRTVREAGYRGARNTRMLRTTLDFDPYAMPTTIQAFPHRHIKYVRNALKAGNIGELLSHTPRMLSNMHWVDFAKSLFDYTLQKGGVFHLYGHSWELDKFDLWTALEKVLSYVSHRIGVNYATNAETVDLLPALKQPQAAAVPSLVQVKSSK